MAKALTPISVANLRARHERYEVADAACPGLRVVVFPSTKKSFVVRYRFRGLPRKLTLGPALLGGSLTEANGAPEIGTPLSLLAARELCIRALRQAKSGNDPAAAKRRRREEELAAASDTLAAIAAEYLRREGPRLRTFSQRKADLELVCASPLGRLPVDQIRRGQYVHLFDRIADERGPVRADRVLSATSRLLSWHAHRSDFVSPLVRGMRRTSIKERARSRVLSDDELRRVWQTAETFPGPFGHYLQFVLLTATRRTEAAGLRRSELSDRGATWIVPGARYKSGLDTLIPLNAAAQRIVAAQPRLAGDYVFSATSEYPLGDFANRKVAFDKASGIVTYTIHDLRRTSRTLLSRAGISADIAEMCLGHVLTGVRGRYDRHAYANEKRHAFEALASLIERIVHPSADVVVPLAKPARRK